MEWTQVCIDVHCTGSDLKLNKLTFSHLDNIVGWWLNNFFFFCPHSSDWRQTTYRTLYFLVPSSSFSCNFVVPDSQLFALQCQSVVSLAVLCTSSIDFSFYGSCVLCLITRPIHLFLPSFRSFVLIQFLPDFFIRAFLFPWKSHLNTKSQKPRVCSSLPYQLSTSLIRTEPHNPYNRLKNVTCRKMSNLVFWA